MASWRINPDARSSRRFRKRLRRWKLHRRSVPNGVVIIRHQKQTPRGLANKCVCFAATACSSGGCGEIVVAKNSRVTAGELVVHLRNPALSETDDVGLYLRDCDSREKPGEKTGREGQILEESF